MNRIKASLLARSLSDKRSGQYSIHSTAVDGVDSMGNDQSDELLPANDRANCQSNSNARSSDPMKAGNFEGDGFPQILERAKNGDRNAIGQLCQISQKYLLLIANQDLNSKALQKFGASDVVQQTMIVANNKISGFNGTTKAEFLSWMKQILVNECRQATRGFLQTGKRNVNRERAIAPSEDDSRQFQLGDPHLTPSSEAVNNEQMRLTVQALDQLSDSDRQLIELRNWEELSFDEIGKVVGKSADSARKSWSRAILKLEKELSKLNAI